MENKTQRRKSRYPVITVTSPMTDEKELLGSSGSLRDKRNTLGPGRVRARKKTKRKVRERK